MTCRFEPSWYSFFRSCWFDWRGCQGKTTNTHTIAVLYFFPVGVVMRVGRGRFHDPGICFQRQQSTEGWAMYNCYSFQTSCNMNCSIRFFAPNLLPRKWQNRCQWPQLPQTLHQNENSRGGVYKDDLVPSRPSSRLLDPKESESQGAVEAWMKGRSLLPHHFKTVGMELFAFFMWRSSDSSVLKNRDAMGDAFPFPLPTISRTSSAIHHSLHSATCAFLHLS